MSQKKKKIAHAHDAIVSHDHIHQAQRTMMEHGPAAVFKQIKQMEPEIAGFISAVSNDIAAHVLMEGPMTRPMAHRLRERIIALALNVYGSYHLAI